MLGSGRDDLETDLRNIEAQYKNQARRSPLSCCLHICLEWRPALRACKQGTIACKASTRTHKLEDPKHTHAPPEQARGWVGFSTKMAHRITAGVDILLMPSR